MLLIKLGRRRRAAITNHAEPRPLSETAKPNQTSVRRGAQAHVALKAGIIGGGKACDNLLTILVDDRMGALNLEILGVADPDDQAPGMLHASDLGIPTFGDFTDLYDLPGLNLLIELTGSAKVRDRMAATKPPQVSTIDFVGARLLWDMFQLESEKLQVEREADEAVRRERDWNQKVLDSLPDQIAVLDTERTVVGVNKTFLIESGLRKDQILGRKCFEVKPCPAESPAHQDHSCPFETVLREGRTASVVYATRGDDGAEVFKEVSAAPIFDQAGRLVQVIEGVRDVTRRVSLERELRQTEQRLRQFLEAAQDIICIKDMAGRYIYVNPAAGELSHRQPEDMVGRADSELFPEKMAKAMAAHDRAVIESGASMGFYEGTRVDGELRWFQTVRYPIFNDDGQMAALSVMARDVTEERALQEEVRRNKEYMENILQNSSDMIITTDLEGRVVTFSPAGERMLGYSRGELVGKSIEGLWQSPEERQSLMAQVQAKGAVNNFTATLLAKDGRSVEVSLSLALLRDSRGKVLGTVGVSKDVTEENRLRRQLIEAERLAAIGQTVAGLAHCIKNILNGLKGGSYLVNTGLKRQDSDLVNEGWRTVQKAINRIGNLSLDMLSYSRERKPELQPVALGEFISGTMDLVAKAAELEGVRFQTTVERERVVLMDPTAMSRALMNLITNAVDACQDVERPAGRAGLVGIDVGVRDGYLLMRVSDNGPGMSAELRSRLFQRFFSTKGSRGTGLGLAVSQKIVGEHGGTIDVESSPGQGSTFTIRLPLATPEKP